MLPESFQRSLTGKCIKTQQGYWTFIPNPLPPKIKYDDSLISLLSEADRLLGELSGTGRLLPNPYLLISAYIRKEAVSSSRIEGTQASLSDLFFFEAAPAKEPVNPDVKEIQNYVFAMEHGIKRLEELPLCIRLIMEVHSVLMHDVRGQYATPGEVRRSQNWIGPAGCLLNEATYVPPPVEEMQQCMSDLEKYLHSSPKEPPLIQCALMHYQFEAIHPFLDGNGRIGRLLVTLFLCEKGFLSLPLLHLSAFFEKYRDEYYSRLLDVSQNGKWKDWLTFFLRGVAMQAKEGIDSAGKIIDLNAKYHGIIQETKKIPESAHRLVDELFLNPFISITEVSKKWGVSFNSVKIGIARLSNAGILREISDKKRNKLYVAPELFDLLLGGK